MAVLNIEPHLADNRLHQGQIAVGKGVANGLAADVDQAENLLFFAVDRHTHHALKLQGHDAFLRGQLGVTFCISTTQRPVCR